MLEAVLSHINPDAKFPSTPALARITNAGWGTSQRISGSCNQERRLNKIRPGWELRCPRSSRYSAVIPYADDRDHNRAVPARNVLPPAGSRFLQRLPEPPTLKQVR